MIRRREFIAGLGSAAAWPLVARTQQARIAHIGVLMTPGLDKPMSVENLAAFRQALIALGHVEGRTFILDVRSADGHPDRFPALAALALRQSSVPRRTATHFLSSGRRTRSMRRFTTNSTLILSTTLRQSQASSVRLMSWSQT
jgi:hypothetical protein